MSRYGLDIVGENFTAAQQGGFRAAPQPTMASLAPKGAPSPQQQLQGPHGGTFRRQGLPFGVRQTLAAGATGTFIARPQRIFRIERIVVSSTGSLSDISVSDLKVGADSQVIDTGDMPGDLFRADAWDTVFRGVTADIGNTISMTLTNNGAAQATVSVGAVGEVID